MEDILKVKSRYLFIRKPNAIKNIKRFILLLIFLHSFRAFNYKLPILSLRSFIYLFFSDLLGVLDLHDLKP